MPLLGFAWITSVVWAQDAGGTGALKPLKTLTLEELSRIEVTSVSKEATTAF